MAKLKLKSVQNGTESGNPNLMASDSYVYVDCSGYVIVGSGVYDNSGNVVEEGCLVIDEGHDELRFGTEPCLQIDVTWDSGVVNLPLAWLGWEAGATGGTPCVSVTFGDSILLFGVYAEDPETKIYYHYDYLVESSEVVVEEDWINPFTAYLDIYYTLTDGHRHFYNAHSYGYFNIPYYYVAPPSDDDDN